MVKVAVLREEKGYLGSEDLPCQQVKALIEGTSGSVCLVNSIVGEHIAFQQTQRHGTILK